MLPFDLHIPMQLDSSATITNLRNVFMLMSQTIDKAVKLCSQEKNPIYGKCKVCKKLHENQCLL